MRTASLQRLTNLGDQASSGEVNFRDAVADGLSMAGLPGDDRSGSGPRE